MWVPLFNAVFESRLASLVTPESGEDGGVRPTDILRSIVGTDIQGDFLKFLREEMRYREYTWDYKNVNIDALRLDESPNWDSLAQQPELFPFPYDWRRDNAESAERLAKYVELIRLAHPDANHVDIVAHSMGGLVSRHFMVSNPGVVENFISVASPLLGATKAVNTMQTGDLGDFILNVLISSDLSKRIARYMPALHQLMPNRGLFDLGFSPLVEDGWSADGDENRYEAYTYDEYKAVLDGRIFKLPDQRDPTPITVNEQFHTHGEERNNVYDWRDDSSGTRHYHIVGVQQMPRTVSRLHLTPAIVPSEPKPEVLFALPPVGFVDSEQIDASVPLLDAEAGLPLQAGSFKLSYSMRVERGAGDGTVPLLSATRGYEAEGHSLNSSNAVMTAVISESTADRHDKAASHVDVLRHPATLGMVRRILTQGLEKEELPQIAISTSDAREGAPMTFSASITGSGVPPGETPIVLWDTGDGRTVAGQSGSHVYGDSGFYTLTCSIYYPVAQIGTVQSQKINVANAPPQLTIEVEPPNPALGELVTIIARITDEGANDRHKFEWRFDGAAEPDPGVSPDAFVVRRSFVRKENIPVEVKVTDDNGGTATANATIRVGTLAGGGNDTPAPDTGVDPTQGAPLEFFDVTITGHETGLTTAVVRQDSSLLSNYLMERLMDFRSVVTSRNAPGDESLRVFRSAADGGSAVPAECTLTVTPAGKLVTMRVRHVPPNGRERAFRWEVPTTPGAAIQLKLRWADLPTITSEQLAARVDAPVRSARVIPVRPGEEPTLLVSVNESTQQFQISSADTTVPDENPVAELGESSIALIEAADLTDADPDDVMTLEGTPVTLLDAKTVASSSVPSGAQFALNQDSRGQHSFADGAPEAAKKTGITPEEIAAIQAAIRQAFTQGAALDLFKKFVFSHADLLLLEQGTGASLWKDSAKCAYVPGSSDNDYEILLPVFKAGLQLNPDNATHRQEFERLAHRPEFMRGDWYFQLPNGVTKDGRDMGPPPDFEDVEAFRKYISIAHEWRYRMPSGLTTLSGHSASIVVSKSDHEVFANPATPAEVISAVLTKTVKDNEALREVLKDISFFPFRREHFLFGVPSVEKPPPFGDDPIGDAGMGRGLLFLKWVLEGVFLPSFAGFNEGVNDAQLRGRIHTRLQERRNVFTAEGYEWGAYQEFALLSESAHLRMQPQAADASQRQVFGNYLDAHDEKVMKKGGKAAIRAALARLVFEGASRATVFNTTPESFDADPELRTFEDYVGRVARAHLSTFSGVNEQDIKDFLGAKLADGETFERIRLQPGGVDAFVEKCFRFIQVHAQIPAAQFYVDHLRELERAGLVEEAAARFRNAQEVDNGIPRLPTAANPAVQLPGRADMLGQQDPADAKYSFIVALHKRDQAAVGPLSVRLVSSPGATLTCPDLTIPADKNMLLINHKNAADKPFFTIKKPIAFNSVARHTFTIEGLGGSNDTLPANNKAVFESHFLQLPFFLKDEFKQPNTRWVFRGINVSEATRDVIIATELSSGRLLSASERNGVAFDVARDDLANEMDQRASAPGFTSFFGFTAQDIALMTPDQKAALLHTGSTPTDSIGISTAEQISRAISAAQTGVDRKYLFALEVPLSIPEQGIGGAVEYLPTSSGAPRRVNPAEGNEVVFLGRLNFIRAHLFEIVASGVLPDSVQVQHLGTFTGNQAPP